MGTDMAVPEENNVTVIVKVDRWQQKLEVKKPRKGLLQLTTKKK